MRTRGGHDEAAAFFPLRHSPSVPLARAAAPFGRQSEISKFGVGIKPPSSWRKLTSERSLEFGKRTGEHILHWAEKILQSCKPIDWSRPACFY